MNLTRDRLTVAAARILRAGGATEPDAQKVAERLVNSNLAGHDSHGVIRLSQYVDQLREGTIKTGQELTTLADFGAVMMFDGNLGFGQVMAEAALRKGLEKCRKFGIAMTGLKNVAHVGRVGEWAELAADEGVVSIHFVNSPARPGVVPFGGKERRMSTNPICIGMPVEGRDAVIVDMTTSSVAEGKLRVARAAGRAIPEGWIVDKNGEPSTDPNDYYDDGAMLTMGGHKGYALSLMVDLFAGALTGGGTTGANETINRNNMTSIYIDPAACDRHQQNAQIAASYLDWIRACQPSVEDGCVLIPGDPERNMRKQRLQGGIDLPAGIWLQIVECAESLGLSEDKILA